MLPPSKPFLYLLLAIGILAVVSAAVVVDVNLEAIRAGFLANKARPVEVEIMRSAKNPRFNWQPVMTGGFGDANDATPRGLIEFRDYLYVMTAGGKIYRSKTGDAASWEKVIDGGFRDESATISIFRSIIAWKDMLYVGTGPGDDDADRSPVGAQVWRSADGLMWKKVASDGFGRGKKMHRSVRSLVEFGDYLYAGTGAEFIGTGAVYRTKDGVHWEQAAEDGFGKPQANQHVYALGVYQGALYAGTFNPYGAEVHRTKDGVTWEKISEGGFGTRRNIYIYELRTYQPEPDSPPRLIAITGPNSRGGEVWSYDGSTWTRIAPPGFGFRRNTDIWQAVQVEKDFYVGTWKIPHKIIAPREKGQGAELWRFDYVKGSWTPETLDGFGNPDNSGIRSMTLWNGAFYVGMYNKKTGVEIWRGTPR